MYSIDISDEDFLEMKEYFVKSAYHRASLLALLSVILETDADLTSIKNQICDSHVRNITGNRLPNDSIDDQFGKKCVEWLSRPDITSSGLN